MSETAIALSVRDLRVIEGDGPRVHDLRLAERLGFKEPRMIRQLIDRNIEELRRYGHVVRYNVERPQGGGSPAQENWLNEAQGLVICMKSETNRAADVRQEIITVFLAWRHGEIVPQNSAPVTELALSVAIQPVIRHLLDIKNMTQKGLDLQKEMLEYINNQTNKKEFPVHVQRQYIACVIAAPYFSHCPDGCGLRILRRGVPIKHTDTLVDGEAVYTIDHWNREHVGLRDGMPAALQCNWKRRDLDVRELQRDKFVTFQGNLELGQQHRSAPAPENGSPLYIGPCFTKQPRFL